MVGRDYDDFRDTRTRKKVLAIYETQSAEHKLGRFPVMADGSRVYAAWRGHLYPLVPNNGPKTGSYSLENPKDAGRLVDFNIT